MNQFLSSKIVKSTLYQKVALLVISLVISLALAEYLVRKLNLAPEVATNLGDIRFVENPRMVYEYVPGSEFEGYRINKQGFYDSDFTLKKTKNVLRIAMLGDSITHGCYVSLKKNFSGRLEVMLNQKVRENNLSIKYEVMNFGVSGYNLEAEVETLKQKVLPYKPDIVVLNLFFNDFDPMPGINLLFVSNYNHLSKEQQLAISKKYIYNRNSILRQFERNVLYRSKLYFFVKMNILGRKNEQIPTDKHDYSQENMGGVYELFKEIDRLQNKYGFKLLICIHPGLLYYEHPNDHKFATLAASFKFHYFYMRQYYEKANVPADALQLKNYPHDTCHPNELGHALIAEAIFTEFKKNNFIDPKLSGS